MIRARLAPESERERIVIDIRTDHDADSRLWWETTAGDPPSLPDRLDAAALALIAKAMNFTQDLHLEGPVSWRLLANLEEYVDAWTRWRPDIFRPVAITADTVVDDRGEGSGPLGGRAVAAFSGGVDGTYSAYAHVRGLLGHRSLDLAAAVLVQGFDIPLDDDAGFALAAAGARAMTDELGIPLVTMRTNWQAVADPEWQMTFGTAVAAVLHLFHERAGNALLAADTTYDAFTLPWGSNPVTGPLLSSSRMRMSQPGAGVGRTEKTRVIGDLASVREHLRVCWQGDDAGRNCQRCEKCVRTKVNFLAAGHGAIPALGPLHPGELRSVTIGSTGAHDLYVELLDQADRLPDDVVEDLRWLVDQPIQHHP
ncbi:hypothetical protein ACE2AJ_01770 [Aquihabitans daechungensis]|uniref:hypothetical protein n=1 Tax=Aquihabitans daechungensis TaxID=1052257 RepID=UPI003BA0499E